MGKEKCAVAMGVYGNDCPVLFSQAVDSVFIDQSAELDIRLYLCVDGPIGRDLERVIENQSARIYMLLRNDKNLGLASSLNRIIDNLSGEIFVARMDADDVCLPMRFKRQIEFLRAHPHIDVVGGAMIEQMPDGSEQQRRYPLEPERCRAHLSRGSPLAHPTVMFRASLFSKGIRYPVVHQNEDIALWFDIADRGIRMANLDVPLLKFRLSKAAVSRRGRGKAYGEFNVYRRGLRKLGFPAWHLVFPFTRFLFRAMPPFIIALLYKSSMRRYLLGSKTK